MKRPDHLGNRPKREPIGAEQRRRFALERPVHLGSIRRAYETGDWEDASAWECVAFVLNYGTARAIEVRLTQLTEIDDWFTGWAGGVYAEEDIPAVRGIEAAKDRLRDILNESVGVEKLLSERWGWKFDDDSGEFREVVGRVGRRRKLVNELAREVYRDLLSKGACAPGNTAENRELVASLLAGVFPPASLGVARGTAIHSALNAEVNPDRH